MEEEKGMKAKIYITSGLRLKCSNPNMSKSTSD